MAKSSPSLRRIPELERVGYLENACLREYINLKHIYVWYPAASGPQACIIELQGENGSIKRTDALTILPLDTPACQVAVESNLALLLSLIGSAQSKAIERMKKDDDLTEWSHANLDEPPFCSQKSGNWTPPLFQVGAVSEDSGRRWQLRKERAEGDSYKEASPEENWWLIEQWSAWEDGEVNRRTRYEAFHTKFGRDATFKDGKDYKKKLNAFSHLYRLSGLECSVKEGKREAASFRRALELKRQLREAAAGEPAPTP